MFLGRFPAERGHPLLVDCFFSVGLWLIGPINYEIDGTNYEISGTDYEIDGTNYIIDAINFLFDGIESVFRGTNESYPLIRPFVRNRRNAILGQRASCPLPPQRTLTSVCLHSLTPPILLFSNPPIIRLPSVASMDGIWYNSAVFC